VRMDIERIERNNSGLSRRKKTGPDTRRPMDSSGTPGPCAERRGDDLKHRKLERHLQGGPKIGVS